MAARIHSGGFYIFYCFLLTNLKGTSEFSTSFIKIEVQKHYPLLILPLHHLIQYHSKLIQHHRGGAPHHFIVDDKMRSLKFIRLGDDDLAYVNSFRRQ